MSPSSNPIEQAINRLGWEATYLRDVLHIAGPVQSVTLSTASVTQVMSGMIDAINLLRSVSPIAPPAGGGVPANVPASGG